MVSITAVCILISAFSTIAQATVFDLYDFAYIYNINSGTPTWLSFKVRSDEYNYICNANGEDDFQPDAGKVRCRTSGLKSEQIRYNAIRKREAFIPHSQLSRQHRAKLIYHINRWIVAVPGLRHREHGRGCPSRSWLHHPSFAKSSCLAWI